MISGGLAPKCFYYYGGVVFLGEGISVGFPALDALEDPRALDVITSGCPN